MLSRHALAAAALTRIARIGARMTPGCVCRLDTGEETAYLTFDDGPHPDITPLLLETLSEHQITATFFLSGAAVESEPELARAVAAAGHTVGQHGYAHLDAWRSRSKSVIQDLERATRLLEDTLGTAVSWMRPPYGHVTPPIHHWAGVRGQRIALWDVMPADYLRSATPERVARHVGRALRPGSIVVLHENDRAAAVSPEAVWRIIESGKRNGYRFDRL